MLFVRGLQVKLDQLADDFAKEVQASKMKGKRPRAVSVAYDRKTGQHYVGESGKPYPDKINPKLKDKMPDESLEVWDVENCAEFKAVNNALNDGANIKNLDVQTLKLTKNGTQSFPRCQNCKATTDGANILSD